MAFDLQPADWRPVPAGPTGDSGEAGGRFVPRDPPDPAAFVAAAVTSAPYRYQARVLVHAPAHVVAEEFSRTSGVVLDAGDGSCLLTTGADSLDVLTFHLAAVRAHFTVLAPPELITYLPEVAYPLPRGAQPSVGAAVRPV